MVKDITKKDVHVTFGCRRFYEDDDTVRSITTDHIGSHPKLLEGLVNQEKDFKAFVRKLAVHVHDHVKVRGVSRTEPGPFHIVSWCRAGEKRSVGWAIIMYHCLTSIGMRSVHPAPAIMNLCALMWRRHTCNGTCEACANYLSPEKKNDPSIKLAISLFTEEWRKLGGCPV